MTENHDALEPRADPFLDEVHALKRAAFADADDDLGTYFRRLREVEQRLVGRLISPPSGAPQRHDAA